MTAVFHKYRSSGAYHWKASTACPWWKRDARTSARYALAARAICRNVPHGSTGLDAGCGDGVALYELARRGYHVIGLDGDDAGLRIARSELRGRDIPAAVIRADTCELPLTNRSVSFVLALDVIEHLTEPARFIAEAHRVLDEAGVLVVTTPNATSALHDPLHVREYSRSDLYSALSARFRSVDVTPFTPLWLARSYRPAQASTLVNRSAAIVHRTLASIGVNPFVRLARMGTRTDDLLAVAHR